MANSAFTPTVFQAFQSDASPSQPGLVNISAQSFAGIKSWDSLGFIPKATFSSGYKLWEDTSNQFRINFSNGYIFSNDDNSVHYGRCNSTSGWTFGASSGLTGQHVIQGDATSNYTLKIQATNASATNGLSNGLVIAAGINSGDTPFFVTNRAGNLSFGGCNGVGAWFFGNLGGTEIQRAYGSEWRLQGENTNGTQLGAGRARLHAPVRVNISPSGSGTFENGQAGAYHVVKGYGTGDNASKRFTDFVVTTETGWTSPTLVLHSSGINSPNARTYTVDGSNRLVVSLGAGGTNIYEVNVAAFSL